MYCYKLRIGAVGGNRTPDLTLTKRLLYQLSYNGKIGKGTARTHILSQGPCGGLGARA